MKNPHLIKIIVPAFIAIAAGYRAPNETTSYSVYHNSKKVGTVTTTKVINDKKITYSLLSDVKIDLIIDISIVEQITDVFESDQLNNSSHSRKINTVEKVNNTASWNGKLYQLAKNGKQGNTITEKIKTTVMSLYYSEPADLTKVYSQNAQQVCTIKKRQAHIYDLQLPDGKTTRYKYSSGKLYAVESNTSWGKVSFYRVK